MERIKNLTKSKKNVYVLLKNEEICVDFFKNAAEAGIMFSDGMKPTEKQCDNIIRLLPNGTICYVGFLGRLYCKSKKCIYFDYEKVLKKRD